MGESSLELFAELAIGLIGFAGVVSALGRSRLSVETVSFRFRALLTNGITALVFSILPLVLAAHGVSAKILWTVATVLLGISQICMMIWAARSVQPISQEEIPIALRNTMFTLMAIAVLYEAYGTIFQPDSLSGVYLVGLSASFGLGLFHFCLLVLAVRTTNESTI